MVDKKVRVLLEDADGEERKKLKREGYRAVGRPVKFYNNPRKIGEYILCPETSAIFQIGSEHPKGLMYDAIVVTEKRNWVTYRAFWSGRGSSSGKSKQPEIKLYDEYIDMNSLGYELVGDYVTRGWHGKPTLDTIMELVERDNPGLKYHAIRKTPVPDGHAVMYQAYREMPNRNEILKESERRFKESFDL